MLLVILDILLTIQKIRKNYVVRRPNWLQEKKFRSRNRTALKPCFLLRVNVSSFRKQKYLFALHGLAYSRVVENKQRWKCCETGAGISIVFFVILKKNFRPFISFYQPVLRIRTTFVQVLNKKKLNNLR